MTNPSPFGRRPRVQRALPRGEVLGAYPDYAEAQRVVDRLAKADFDVSKLAIVGSDLKTVEFVTGKLSWGRAALAGAVSGAWIGIFVGVLLLFVSPDEGLGYAVAAVLIAAGLGMILGLATYAVGRARRDFSSTTQVIAASYEVIVEPAQLLRARELLERPE